MAGVAHQGSTVAQSTKSGHVTYSIERYVDSYCNSWDENGACNGWGGGYWTGDGNGSTDALITAQGVTASSPNVYVNGKAMATIRDEINESWVADPSIPSNTSSKRYTATSPVNGTGKGSVTSGSPKVFCNGKRVAMINSQVTSHLDTTSKITSGSSNVFAD